MNNIDPEALRAALAAFQGEMSYTHMEVTPGGFVRNLSIRVEDTYVHGLGPYRVALRLAEHGWIRVEGLTHMVQDDAGRLLLAGHDEEGKLTTALELSRTPFDK